MWELLFPAPVRRYIPANLQRIQQRKSQHGGTGCLRVERRAVRLRNKYGRVAVKQSKSTTMDFSTVEDLAEAKLHLLTGIRTLENT